VFIISLPVIFVNGSDNVDANSSSGLSVLEYVMIIGFGFGVIFEIIADVQKSVWVKKGREGGFCTVGVWKYSRHPNYFGEIFQWWCVWLFGYGSSAGVTDIQWWVGILSPLFTMQILLNTGGTGVANANGKNLKRYYDRFPLNMRSIGKVLLL
jgi:steroid 5-alpha reductase family enzyme